MKREDVGLLLLRIGLGGIFVWFGIDKFFHPIPWSKYMPVWFSSMLPTEPVTFMYVMGVFELIVGLAVLLGIYARLAALISAVFLLGVISGLGLVNEIAARDASIMMLALGIALLGPGSLTFGESFFKRKRYG